MVRAGRTPWPQAAVDVAVSGARFTTRQGTAPALVRGGRHRTLCRLLDDGTALGPRPVLRRATRIDAAGITILEAGATFGVAPYGTLLPSQDDCRANACHRWRATIGPASSAQSMDFGSAPICPVSVMPNAMEGQAG